MIPALRRPLGDHTMQLGEREQRPTSMCMGINEWDHSDCPGDFCSCDCHKAAS